MLGARLWGACRHHSRQAGKIARSGPGLGAARAASTLGGSGSRRALGRARTSRRSRSQRAAVPDRFDVEALCRQLASAMRSPPRSSPVPRQWAFEGGAAAQPAFALSCVVDENQLDPDVIELGPDGAGRRVFVVVQDAQAEGFEEDGGDDDEDTMLQHAFLPFGVHR
mmetsp:Transcript_116763/g.363608  ORF Transcript_116763/g.363608 Transcript_116763/m.363608 type:complete len:167 (+) Transcript_116763:65-565(+)